jgi:hypothetical protein
MRKIIIAGLLCLTGCQNLVGPFGYRSPTRVDDPRLPIEEQQKRARDRLALPDETGQVGPRLDLLPPNQGAAPNMNAGGR